MDTFRADIEDRKRERAAAREERREARRNDPRARWTYWALWALGALVLLLLVGGLLGRNYLYKDMPSLPDRAAMWELNLKPNVTLLDREGNRLGHRGPDIGRIRTIPELPDYVPNAFLAIEDERFFEHEGVDRQAIIRAFWSNLREGDRGQGGSTLTQQLVKNLVLSPEKTYRRKFQEAVLAYRLETVLTKPEILELYMNRTPMGKQVFGLEAAAQTYFGKPATELELNEAVLLAGVPKAPSRLDPRDNFNGAWARAGLVLDRMVANQLITPSEAAATRTSPPDMVPVAETALGEDLLGFAFDYTLDEAKALIGEDVQDLVITVTLDAEKTSAARDALNTILDKNGESKKVSEGALVSLDNGTGAILAMTGGRSYEVSKFNRAVQAQRQPGSAFKAFVYAAALEDGFTPGTVRIDQPLTIDKWKPENYTERYRGPMTLREALKHSINTIAAQVGAEVGPTRVSELARRFGIESELRPVYSLALGSSEVNLLELTGAFAVFPNEGLRRPPYLIEKITDSNGRSLYQRRPRTPERVYSRDFARQMNSMLGDVVDTGTAYAARFGGRELAGKTGTSQDYRDAWFVGFSGQFTTGVWLGNDDNSQMNKITGGLLPVDVWKAYMRTVHDGLPQQPLPKPELDSLSAYRESVVAFYADLGAELESERNAAAGISQ